MIFSFTSLHYVIHSWGKIFIMSKYKYKIIVATLKKTLIISKKIVCTSKTCKFNLKDSFTILTPIKQPFLFKKKYIYFMLLHKYSSRAVLNHKK